MTWWRRPAPQRPGAWISSRSRTNYYEDLDARFDLDPAFLATLRELNLLYDRDADGEFLHFYTATVGSVFFEMVERRGAYDGYGAPNAPVRHAVQYDHLHQLNPTS